MPPVTLMIVDDSPTVRNLIKVQLVGRSFDFLEAGEGGRALQMLRLLPVSIVIADVNMPGMDGLTMVRKLRAETDEKLRSIPVILLTSDKSEEVRLEGLRAGANDFVLKPVSSANLLEVVQKYLPEAH